MSSKKGQELQKNDKKCRMSPLKKAVVGVSITSALVLLVGYILYRKEARVYSAPLSLYFLATDKNTGYLDKEKYFPGHELLESQWQIIQEEYLNYINNSGKLVSMDKADAINRMYFKDAAKKWKMIVLKHSGKWLDSNCKHFPRTVEIMREFPEVTRVMFSVFEPRSYLKTHRAYSKTILRYLLGIVVPQNPSPYLVVDGERTDFEEGKGIMFDDTFYHSSHNDNDEARVVLFLDIKRPAKSKFVSKLMDYHDEFISNSPWYKNYTDQTEKQFSLED
jgi:beta-hydroxylase